MRYPVLPADHPARATVASSSAWLFRGASPPPDPGRGSAAAGGAFVSPLTAAERDEIRFLIDAAIAHPPPRRPARRTPAP